MLQMVLTYKNMPKETAAEFAQSSAAASQSDGEPLAWTEEMCVALC